MESKTPPLQIPINEFAVKDILIKMITSKVNNVYYSLRAGHLINCASYFRYPSSSIIFPHMEQLATNWFLLYYSLLGLVFLIQGLIWAINPRPFLSWLAEAAASEKRPRYIMRMLRYFLIFSGISLVFAFFPFSVYELIFALWSLAMAYLAGSVMLRWPDYRHVIQEHRASFNTYLRRFGLLAISISLIIFALGFRLAVNSGIA